MNAPQGQIVVTRTAEPATYQVEVRDRATTRHTVTVRPAYLTELNIASAAPEKILREAFAFLLDRESNTSILSRFDLADIERYFPEFRTDIGPRLRASL